MTTPDPVQVAYDVLEDAMTPNRDDPAGHWLSELPPDLLAQRIAAAYGMAGLLLPDGTQTCEEWAYQVEGQAAPWGGTRNRDRAVEKLTAHRDAWPSVRAHLVERHVHTEPWQPAPTQEQP
jgi:hypothetical protein